MKTATKKAPDELQDSYREQSLLHELPLVHRIARQIHARLPRHVALEDLVQAGVLGLMDAYSKYNRRKHVQFRTYAKIRVRGAILDSLRELDWGSRALRRRGRRIEDARESLRCALGREPSETELACQLGIPLRDLQTLRWDLDRLVTASSSSPSTNDVYDQDFVECAAAPVQQTPYCVHLHLEVTEMLSKLIAGLPSRQRQVLALYYQQELTMKQVGAAMGLGESRISQLHTSAVSELRARLEALDGQMHSKHSGVGLRDI